MKMVKSKKFHNKTAQSQRTKWYTSTCWTWKTRL